ncbi:hypothetical protein, partial [Streptomyces niveus]
PHPGESTHRHALPCEYPDTRCVCPPALPVADTERARARSRIAAAFVGARWARTYLSAGGR